jgi:hypothetical protein
MFNIDIPLMRRATTQFAILVGWTFEIPPLREGE